MPQQNAFEHSPSRMVRWLQAISETATAVGIWGALVFAGFVMVGVILEINPLWAPPGVEAELFDIVGRAIVGFESLAALAMFCLVSVAVGAISKVPGRGAALLKHSKRGDGVPYSIPFGILILLGALAAIGGFAVSFDYKPFDVPFVQSIILMASGVAAVVGSVLILRWLRKPPVKPQLTAWMSVEEWQTQSGQLRQTRGFVSTSIAIPGAKTKPMGAVGGAVEKWLNAIAMIVGVPGVVVAAMVKPAPGSTESWAPPVIVVFMCISIGLAMLILGVLWLWRLINLVRVHSVIHRALNGKGSRWPADSDVQKFLQGLTPNRQMYRLVVGASGALAVAWWAIAAHFNTTDLRNDGWPNTYLVFPHANPNDFLMLAAILGTLTVLALPLRVYGLKRDAELRNFIREEKARLKRQRGQAAVPER